jgi:hypothetical protein
MAISFVRRWSSLLAPDQPLSVLVPTVDVAFAGSDSRLLLRTFLVDSGADISMAPRQLCDDLGLDWEDGVPIDLKGISPKPECAVLARVFEIELLVPDIGIAFFVPICFADGDASQILGREGFFDAFRITFDKRRLTTQFELIEEAEEH